MDAYPDIVSSSHLGQCKQKQTGSKNNTAATAEGAFLHMNDNQLVPYECPRNAPLA